MIIRYVTFAFGISELFSFYYLKCKSALLYAINNETALSKSLYMEF